MGKPETEAVSRLLKDISKPDIVAWFLKQEFQELPKTPDRPGIAAVGTIAQTYVNSELLRESLVEAGIEADDFRAYPDLKTLVEADVWTMAVVLSPYKHDAIGACQQLTSTAQATGVIDAFIRSDKGIIGVNTTAYAAQTAMEQLVGGNVPMKVLIAGTGASARSAIVAVHSAFPQAEIGVIGRNAEKARSAIRDVGGVGSIVNDLQSFGADLVINATTVGQANNKDPLGFNLEASFSPNNSHKVYFLDFNPGETALTKTAMAKGCNVLLGISSGTFMQVINSKLRAALLHSPGA